MIDGQRQPERLDWQTCCGGVVDTMNVSRIYALPAGSHSLEVALSCQNLLVVHHGWLTVYELPNVRR